MTDARCQNINDTGLDISMPTYSDTAYRYFCILHIHNINQEDDKLIDKLFHNTRLRKYLNIRWKNAGKTAQLLQCTSVKPLSIMTLVDMA